MTVKLEKIENCEAYFEFVIDADEMEKGLQKSYKKVVKKLNVPGFRKGAAPREVVESNFGLDVLLEEALDIVVPDKYYAAVKELELQTVGDPDIEVGFVVKGEPVTVKAIIPLYPQVTLGKLGGLEVNAPMVAAVTDYDVERSLEETRQHNKKVTDKMDEPAVAGDQVTIDYEGSMGEISFQGDKDFKVLIGSDTFIPGFEEQLIGAKQGDKLKVRITFAEDHPSKQLAGNTAVFDVQVKKVEDVEEVIMDDQFAQDVANLNNMEEFRADLKKKLSENADMRQAEFIRQAVLASAVEASEVNVPEYLVMEVASSAMEQFMNQLKAEGGSIELYAQMIGKSVEEVKKQFWTDAKRSTRITHMLYKMVTNMDFDISEEELNEGIMNFARQYNMHTENLDELKKNIGPMHDRIALELKSGKAAKYLIDHAIITLVDPKEMQMAAEKSQLN